MRDEASIPADLLPHLREAAGILARAIEKGGCRGRVVMATRRLISVLAGKAPRVTNFSGHADDYRCDLCFKRLYDVPRSQPLCPACEGAPPELGLKEAREADRDRQAAIAAQEARVQADLERLQARPDVSGIPTVKRKRTSTHAKRAGQPSRTHPDVPRITEPEAGHRVLAMLLGTTRWHRLSVQELWTRSRGALTLEQVGALVRHPWFVLTETGTCTLTPLAWSEYLDVALEQQQRTG